MVSGLHCEIQVDLLLLLLHISLIASRFTKNKSLVAGALSWGLSALILLIPVFVSGNTDPEFGYNQQSGKLLEKCGLKTAIIYFLPGTCTILKKPDQYIIFSFCIVVPYLIILICYITIISHVRRSKRNIELNK